LELEDRRHAALEFPPGRLDTHQRSAVGAEQPELGDHGIVRMVQHDQLVALIPSI